MAKTKKDSFWFRHDAGAGRGLRMKKMAFLYDHWGKGVYWDVCEILRSQERYRYPTDELSLKMLADLIGCKNEEKFFEWFKYCIELKLFEEKDGYFYSEVLAENMQKWETKKKNGAAFKKNKLKRKGSETISEKEAKEERIEGNKRIEENRTEENIIEQKRTGGQTEIKKEFLLKDNIQVYFEDLPNSIELDQYCMINNINKGKMLSRIAEFKKHASSKYTDFKEFFDHFKRWVLKNPLQAEIITTAPPSFKPPKTA